MVRAVPLVRTGPVVEVLAEYDRRAEQVRELLVERGSPTVSVAQFGPGGLETHGT